MQFNFYPLSEMLLMIRSPGEVTGQGGGRISYGPDGFINVVSGKRIWISHSMGVGRAHQLKQSNLKWIGMYQSFVLVKASYSYWEKKSILYEALKFKQRRYELLWISEGRFFPNVIEMQVFPIASFLLLCLFLI